MRIPEITSIDRAEWLKLLRVKGAPDEKLSGQMNEAEHQLLEAVSPRGIYRVLSVDQLPLEGISIRKHLEGCSRAALLAVTCGGGIDALLRRAQVTNMTMALLLDAGASVLAEHIADAAEDIIKKELNQTHPVLQINHNDRTNQAHPADHNDRTPQSAPQIFTTSRFSPGYGDYPIRCQRDLLALLDAPRKIGVNLSSGGMMIPSKSISALIGLSDHPVKGRLAPCSECLLRETCSFLKDGQHC